MKIVPPTPTMNAVQISSLLNLRSSQIAERRGAMASVQVDL
jgi:hypothetical protein